MIEPLTIAASGDSTPAVILDPAKNRFEISGWSFPENSMKFYEPVLAWLNRYAESPSPHFDFHFKLQYFNTSSAKQVFRIISTLENFLERSKVTIKWHYDKEDEDMQASGDRFAKMTTVPFEFVVN